MGSPLGDVPIFIAMMHPNGVAAQTQKLRVSFTNSPGIPSKFGQSFDNPSESGHLLQAILNVYLLFNQVTQSQQDLL